MDKVLNGLEKTVGFFYDIQVQGSSFEKTIKPLKEVLR